MGKYTSIELSITINKSDSMLMLAETIGAKTTILLTASIVSGCDDSGTPSGKYKSGKWIRDKTNVVYGPIPWSKDKWGNPYGPYFLQLNDFKTGRYTTYGIHGTRGPVFGNFEKPPIPERLVRLFVDDDTYTKYLYCSHGCIRLSNLNITKLYEATVQGKYAGKAISVLIQ